MSPQEKGQSFSPEVRGDRCSDSTFAIQLLPGQESPRPRAGYLLFALLGASGRKSFDVQGAKAPSPRTCLCRALVSQAGRRSPGCGAERATAQTRGGSAVQRVMVGVGLRREKKWEEEGRGGGLGGGEWWRGWSLPVKPLPLP